MGPEGWLWMPWGVVCWGGLALCGAVSVLGLVEYWFDILQGCLITFVGCVASVSCRSLFLLWV